MANLIRSATRSSNDWTTNELDAYNITIVSQTKHQFFGTQDLPYPNDAPPGFLTTENRENATNPKTQKLLYSLDLAMTPAVGNESAVGTFASKLLERLGYDEGYGRIVVHRKIINFLICGVWSWAQADVAVIDDESIILLVEEDRSLSDNKDPEPQLIAEAIAAYEANNRTRVQDLELPTLESMMFPAITMQGTFARFYKITVTAELSAAVKHGTYPPTPTMVLRYIPSVPRRRSEGMRPISNRVELIKCFLSFKQFLGVSLG